MVTVRPVWFGLLLSAAVLAGVSLTGCTTPPPESRVAIHYLGQGRAEILALVCKGDLVTSVSLYESADNSKGRGWVVGPPGTRKGDRPDYAQRTHLLRITPFKTPHGWETQEQSLTALESGTQYGLDFVVPGPDSRIEFTPDQLDGIGDQVLTGPWLDERAMSESDFTKTARAYCD